MDPALLPQQSCVVVGLQLSWQQHGRLTAHAGWHQQAVLDKVAV